MTFDKLEKDNIINLYFRSIRNILLDRKPKNRLRNKILRLKKQKTVLKPFKQFKNHNINLTESAPKTSDYNLKSLYTRLIVFIKVFKKSVT
jgi:hypothetical protein